MKYSKCTFDLFAFRRARSFVQKTPNVRRHQFVVLQKLIHVQMIESRHVPGGRGELRRSAAVRGAADDCGQQQEETADDDRATRRVQFPSRFREHFSVSASSFRREDRKPDDNYYRQ